MTKLLTTIALTLALLAGMTAGPVRAESQAEIAAKGKALLDEHGNVAMHWAAVDNEVEAMKWLKAQGADVNARDKDDYDSIRCTTRRGAMPWMR